MASVAPCSFLHPSATIQTLTRSRASTQNQPSPAARLNAADVASVTKCLCVGRGTTICWGATLGVRLFVLTLNLYYSFGERLTSSGVTTSSTSCHESERVSNGRRHSLHLRSTRTPTRSRRSCCLCRRMSCRCRVQRCVGGSGWKLKRSLRLGSPIRQRHGRRHRKANAKRKVTRSRRRQGTFCGRGTNACAKWWTTWDLTAFV